MSEGRKVQVTDGRFTDHFEEGDARIYTTDPAAAQFPTTKEIEAELAQRQAETAKPGNLLHVSQGTRVSASAGFHAPWFDQYYYYAINGITDDMGWAATHAGDKPASLEVTMKAPRLWGASYPPNLKDYDILRGPDDHWWPRSRERRRWWAASRPLWLSRSGWRPLSSRRRPPDLGIEAYEQPERVHPRS